MTAGIIEQASYSLRAGQVSAAESLSACHERKPLAWLLQQQELCTSLSGMEGGELGAGRRIRRQGARTGARLQRREILVGHAPGQQLPQRDGEAEHVRALRIRRVLDHLGRHPPARMSPRLPDQARPLPVPSRRVPTAVPLTCAHLATSNPSAPRQGFSLVWFQSPVLSACLQSPHMAAC